MFLLFVLASIIALGQSHICLLSPPQRGDLSGINRPASPNCNLLNGPCGERQPSSRTYYEVGDNMTVIFLKNVNHYNPIKPGEFVVKLKASDRSLTRVLARFPDGGEFAPHLYRISFPVPDKNIRPDVDYYIQVTYVPNNPLAAQTYYQCTDVGFKRRL